ncbi:MAG TPA: hypothetical protein VHZ49_22645 [Methylomirabilota bacterium]|jgi:hypothetical protein|nr:hypothetical protein [Methylomirabilota bacterium]
MVRSLVAAALAVLMAASVAAADGTRAAVATSPLSRGSIIPRVGPIIPNAPNIVPNPPRERIERRDHRGFQPGVVFVNPPVVYAAPQQCVSPGYWAYQWVPTAYSQSTWIPGGWTADGAWIDGHVEQRAYASGYYQPYWVPDQPYAC